MGKRLSDNQSRLAKFVFAHAATIALPPTKRRSPINTCLVKRSLIASRSSMLAIRDASDRGGAAAGCAVNAEPGWGRHMQEMRSSRMSIGLVSKLLEDSGLDSLPSVRVAFRKANAVGSGLWLGLMSVQLANFF